VLSTTCRQLIAATLLIGALGGCNAAGQPTGTRTYSNPHVPFTFLVPGDFTNAAIDEGDTRGTVIAATGLTKVDVIAVRRVTGGVVVVGSNGPESHEVQGHAVKSELGPLPHWPGWYLECQYTPDFAKKVRDACRQAIATVRRR
jgi:hypothetical protein